jgi:hypothetical protein
MFAPPSAPLPRPTDNPEAFGTALREKMARNRQLTQSGQWDNTLAMAMPQLLDGSFYTDPTHGVWGATNLAERLVSTPMYDNLTPWWGDWKAAQPTREKMAEEYFQRTGKRAYNWDIYQEALNAWANQGLNQLKDWGTQNPNWQQLLRTRMGGGQPQPQPQMGPGRGGHSAPPAGRDYGRFLRFMGQATNYNPGNQQELRNGRVVGSPGGYMAGLQPANNFFAGTPWGQGITPMRAKPTTFGNGEMDQWRADYQNWLTNANNQFKTYQQSNPNWLQDAYNWWSQANGGQGDASGLQQAYDRFSQKANRNWAPPAFAAPPTAPVAPTATPVQQAWQQAMAPNANRRALWGLR